ncbi:MAG: ABC transporter substrate-binding protein [Clostridium sp.]
MKLKKSKVISLIMVCALSLGLFAGCGEDDSNIGVNGTLNVYNCADYIDESLIKQFERESGIDVIYDTYDTNENMYNKLKSGNGSYDVVFPSDYMIEKMIKEDMLEKIDFNNIPNYSYIGEGYKNLPYDPNNEYSVPYMWGTIGIVYNPKIVTEEVDSWDILWNEKYSKQIIMFDSIRDTMAVALKKLGYSINTTNPKEIDEAADLLIEQKPLVRAYQVDDVKITMISEEAALATVWSGDAAYIMNENPDLKYVVPKEGSNKWFDGMCIVKGSKNKENAEKFINFLCDPENALTNVEEIQYSTPNTETFEMLDEASKELYPTQETLDKCEVFIDLGDNLKLYDEAWTKVKTK